MNSDGYSILDSRIRSLRVRERNDHGKAPVSYCREESQDPENQCKSDFEIFVNRLTSSDSAIPFEYNSFDFCKGKFYRFDSKIGFLYLM